MIAVLAMFIVGCVHSSIYYCPYCGHGGITEIAPGEYKCENSKCGKTFGAMKL